MKKLLLVAIITVFTSSLFAQVTICDFESALGAEPAILGGSKNATGEVVANPAPDAINGSANVLKTTCYAIGGTPSGNKIDAVMFQLPSGTTFQAADYQAIKVNVYVAGGTPGTILKPRGKAGIWVDADTSPTPGTWIGVVKNRKDGEDGLAINQTGWMECYFDISAKTNTDDYDTFQIQLDWNDARDSDLEIFFDDFELVTSIPTGIEDELVVSPSIFAYNNIIKVQSELNVVEILVVDMTGRVVQQLKGQNLQKVNINALPNGVYIAKVKADGAVFTQKVLKR